MSANSAKSGRNKNTTKKPQDGLGAGVASKEGGTGADGGAGAGGGEATKDDGGGPERVEDGMEVEPAITVSRARVPSYARATTASRRASGANLKEDEKDYGRGGMKEEEKVYGRGGRKRYTDPFETRRRFETILAEKLRYGPGTEQVPEAAETMQFLSPLNKQLSTPQGDRELTRVRTGIAGESEAEKGSPPAGGTSSYRQNGSRSPHGLSILSRGPRGGSEHQDRIGSGGNRIRELSLHADRVDVRSSSSPFSHRQQGRTLPIPTTQLPQTLPHSTRGGSQQSFHRGAEPRIQFQRPEESPHLQGDRRDRSTRGGGSGGEGGAIEESSQGQGGRSGGGVSEESTREGSTGGYGRHRLSRDPRQDQLSGGTTRLVRSGGGAWSSDEGVPRGEEDRDGQVPRGFDQVPQGAPRPRSISPRLRGTRTGHRRLGQGVGGGDLLEWRSGGRASSSSSVRGSGRSRPRRASSTSPGRHSLNDSSPASNTLVPFNEPLYDSSRNDNEVPNNSSSFESPEESEDPDREYERQEDEEVQGNEEEDTDPVPDPTDSSGTVTVLHSTHPCNASCHCRKLIADLQETVRRQSLNATVLDSMIRNQSSELGDLRIEFQEKCTRLSEHFDEQLEEIDIRTQNGLAELDDRVMDLDDRVQYLEVRTGDLMELAQITVMRNDEDYVDLKHRCEAVETLSADVTSGKVQLRELRREIANATRAFATARSNEMGSTSSPTPQGNAPVQSLPAPPTIPRTPIAMIRSQWDTQYKRMDDPIEQRKSGVHFEEAVRDQISASNPITAGNSATEFGNRKNLPTVKDLPIFSGRIQVEKSVTLPTFFQLLILMRQARKCSDNHITSLFSSILKDDALQIYTTTFQLEPASENWTLEEWYQRFLSYYHTASFLSDLRAEKVSYRYPRSESDPHVWASTFLAKCVDIDRALTVDAFVESMQLNILEPLRSKLGEKHQKEHFKTHLEVTMAFGRMAEKQKSSEGAVARELGRATKTSNAPARPKVVESRSQRNTGAISNAPTPSGSSSSNFSKSRTEQLGQLTYMKRSLDDNRKCFGCGKTGHIRRDCKNPKKQEQLGEVGAVMAAYFEDFEEGIDELVNDLEQKEEAAEDSESSSDKKVGAAYYMAIQQEIDEEEADELLFKNHVGVVGIVTPPEARVAVANDPLDDEVPQVVVVGQERDLPSLTIDDFLNEHAAAGPRDVVRIPQHLVTEVVSSRPIKDVAMKHQAKDGQMYLRGKHWKITFALGCNTNVSIKGLADTGASPTICKLRALQRIDPDCMSKLVPCPIEKLGGLNGGVQVYGIYSESVILPHVSGNLRLMRVEFLVAENYDLPYDFILGQDTGYFYDFCLIRSDKGSFLKVGKNPQHFHLGEVDKRHLIGAESEKPIAATETPREDLSLPEAELQQAATDFPSGSPDITIEELNDILRGNYPAPSEELLAAMDELPISGELTEVQQKQVRAVLFGCASALALKGEIYENKGFGEPVEIIANIPSPAPAALKKAPYPSSHKAREDLWNELQSLLKKGIITRSESPYAAPAFMVYRKEKPRLVIDFRAMNVYIVVPAYPLPHLTTQVALIGKSKYKTAFDLKGAFNTMLLTLESRKYTAFSTPWGLFEYVMGMFGLSCMPPNWQMRVDQHFHLQLIQEWLSLYIDDGLICSDSFVTHLWQLFIVLQMLMGSGARIALDKFFIGFSEIKYLGWKINSLYIALDKGRVAAVLAWATPRNRADVQSFLGFVGYHRQFIKGYATIVLALQALVTEPWKWGEAEEAAFQAAKTAMVDAVVLHFPNWDLPFIVYTDASQDGLGAGLYQKQDGKEVPLAFISRQVKRGEKRYGATQLECLAVVWMLEKFHFYIHGATFTVVTDCAALRSLLTAKWVNRHMLRWQIAIQDYRGNMTIVHRPGKENSNADGPSRNALPNEAWNPASNLDPDESVELGCIKIGAVSVATERWNRKPTFPLALAGAIAFLDDSGEDHLDEDEDLSDQSVCPTVDEIDATKLCAPIRVFGTSSAAISTFLVTDSISTDIAAGYQQDPAFKRLLECLTSEEELEPLEDTDPVLREEYRKGRLYTFDGLIYRKVGFASGVVVCDAISKTRLLDSCHDQPLAGHFSIEKTREKLRQFAWWPHFTEDVRTYCESCKPCLEAKRLTGKPFGLLQRIEMPSRPWEMVNMDFVTALPPAGPEGLNSVLVVSDRFSRRTRFCPCHKTITAVATAQLFNRYIISQHGTPSVIISDRDPKFTSDFWRTFHEILQVKLAMSTAHHPQTDGLAERSIGTLEEALRLFCAFGLKQGKDGTVYDWTTGIFQFEFAYNSTKHSTTGKIPFEMDIGRVPPNTLDSLATTLGGLPQFATSLASTHAQHLTRAQVQSQSAIKAAHDSTQRRYDQKHKLSPIKEGDWVLISSKFFKFAGTYNKMKTAFIGPPFQVEKMIGPNAARLVLRPPFHRRHPTFPISLLRRVPTPQEGFATRREYRNNDTREASTDEFYGPEDVELILSERRFSDPEDSKKSILEYLVRWKDYSSDHDTWISSENLKTPELLRMYRADRRNEENDLESALKSDANEEDDSPEYEVEKIVQERYNRSTKAKEYKIRWLNFLPADDTWEPLTVLGNAQEIVEAWEEQKKKPKDSLTPKPSSSQPSSDTPTNPHRTRAAVQRDAAN